jgi:hypothetical protein
MSNCVICDSEINSRNDSREHVIPGSIGGRLRIKGFICKSCNNDAGRTWDAELASQLLPLSLMFGVERQRGSMPRLSVTTTAGEKLSIGPQGELSLAKPAYSEALTEQGIKIQITARSTGEAKRFLSGVKRKYPDADVDGMLSELQPTRSYPKGAIHHRLDFGGNESGRSIVKSAAALAHLAGISVDQCSDAISYLRDAASPPCFGYYQAGDLVSSRPPGVPFHCVSVEANRETGLILGYVEYFGVHRVVVCLGRCYSDDQVEKTYAIDPRSGERLGLDVRLGFDAGQIQAIYNYEMIPDGAIAEAFAKLIPTALKRQFESERDRVTKEAVEYALANCGAKPGAILTEEQVKKLPSLIMEKLTPLLLHNLARRRPIASDGEKR